MATEEQKAANLARFEEDLEFVQSLANPYFVHEIAMKGTLSTPEMLNYLTYLKYFHSPSYSRFLRYPLGLSTLDLLVASPTFRTEIAKPEVAHLFGRKILAGWMHAGGAGKDGGEARGVGEVLARTAEAGRGAPGLGAVMNGAITEDMELD